MSVAVFWIGKKLPFALADDATARLSAVTAATENSRASHAIHAGRRPDQEHGGWYGVPGM